MAEAPTMETYVPRLKERYEDEIRPQLQSELGFSTVMDVPKVTKVTLNMGVGEAKTDAKALDAAIDELTLIAGQRAQVRRATKSIASFKLREVEVLDDHAPVTRARLEDPSPLAAVLAGEHLDEIALLDSHGGGHL